MNYAHRGFSGKYPENTMLAYRKAIEAGCDGIELDVQFSKDHELVLIHDEKIDRTCCHKGYVKDYTYEQLSAFDFSYKFKFRVPFQKIPTLREYFELVKNLDIITNIELKTSIIEYPGIEQAVYDLICEYNLQKKVVISSFNHYSILRMKALDPHLVCGFLTESCLIAPGSYVSMQKVEGYHPRYTSLSKEVVQEVHEHGIRINTWTPNGKEDIQKVLDLGVDGIITNYPDRVRQCMEGKSI